MKTLFHRLAVAVLLLAGLAGQAIAAPHAPAPADPGTAVHQDRLLPRYFFRFDET